MAYILGKLCETGGYMLNYLWAGMIGVGILFGILQGNLADLTNAALDSSKEAVTLCITMTGVMSFWMGLMEIATKAGLIQSLSKKISPVIHFLFPKIPKGHQANEYITTNIIANMLGLGWAATPAGLQAMKSLEELEDERRVGRYGGSAKDKGVASDEMCNFLILNISSLQLISINVIAYRSQYGSVNPAGIVGAGLIATMISTLVGVIYCKMRE